MTSPSRARRNGWSPRSRRSPSRCSRRASASGGRHLDVLRDLPRRGSLFFHGARDGGGHLVDLAHRHRDLLDRRNCRSSSGWRRCAGQSPRRLRGLVGQRLDLGGHDGEPPVKLASYTTTARIICWRTLCARKRAHDPAAMTLASPRRVHCAMRRACRPNRIRATDCYPMLRPKRLDWIFHPVRRTGTWPTS